MFKLSLSVITKITSNVFVGNDDYFGKQFKFIQRKKMWLILAVNSIVLELLNGTMELKKDTSKDNFKNTFSISF